MSNYRKIWEQHYGPIPIDDNGRRCEIHHIDGNRKNNNIDNLMLVTIQEHYDIHYRQNDWAACQSILLRMNVSPEEHSKLQSDLARKRVADGTHHFLDSEYKRKDSERKKQRVGSLNSMWGKKHDINAKLMMSKSHKKAVEAGTHHTLTKKYAEASRLAQNKLLSEGKHTFQINRINQIAAINNMIKSGTHPLQAENRIDPNVIAVSCIICHRQTTLPALSSHHKHNDKQRLNPGSIRMCCISCKKEINKSAFSRWHSECV